MKLLTAVGNELFYASFGNIFYDLVCGYDFQRKSCSELKYHVAPIY